jgi:pimeloyl-ACP methyl ester carboxylesterase
MASAPLLERVPLELPVDVRRAGAGDPLVLLHGFGASRFTWRRWPARLAETHTLYLVDARGCGDASKERGLAYGTAAIADDVVAMIRSLDLRRVTLIGHSLGGAVALLTILRLIDLGEGDRVSGLVSVAGVGYPQTLPKAMKQLANPLVGRLFNLISSRWIVRRILRMILADPSIITQEMIDGYAAPLRSRDTRRALFASVRELVPENVDELVRRYSSVPVPTLLIWGDRDGVVPLSVGKRLARDLPNARLEVLQLCGHLPPEEKPEETLALVTEFLAKRAG